MAKSDVKYFICLCNEIVLQHPSNRMVCNKCERGYSNKFDDKGKHQVYMSYHPDEKIDVSDADKTCDVLIMPEEELSVKFNI